MAQLLPFCIAAALICAAQGGTVNFTFPPQTYFEEKGDAFFDGKNVVQLTDNQTLYSFGWLTYKEPVPLWNGTSDALANFTTHFQFIIGRPFDETTVFGDGLAFFLAPFQLAKPLKVYGGGFGLFSEATNEASPYPIVAVEFDTYENNWDPDGNHVGVDVSGVISKKNVSLSNISSYLDRPDHENLKNGKQWDAWVDYNGVAKRLDVFLQYNPENNMKKPQLPILSHNIDLRKTLPETVKVGFSASTLNDRETHSVSFWNFTSQNSWTVTTSPAPGNVSTSPPLGNVSTSPPPENKKRSVEILLISILVPLVAICGVIFGGSWWYFRHRRLDKPEDDPDVELDECFAQGPRRFAYAELAAATGNFSEEHQLGQGGFGAVYKGTLTGSSVVAVKRISQGSKQGRKEYISEVTVISKLRHRNLVQLLGWCHERGDLLLVYEFLPNGSLDRYIFHECEVNLHWKQRYSVACDIASALVYLHEEGDQRVVHRDVKASNVMLDSDFTAKLGDFGLARLVERDRAESNTTVVAGTMGYMAPECVATGKATCEADVFSFGAVSLEIACGRRPVDRTLGEYNCRLVEWVWDLHSQGRILDAADERLNGDFDDVEMKRLMAVGLLCSHPDSKARPGIWQVLKILKSEAKLPHVPLNFPVAVYNDDSRQRLREVMMSSTTSWSTGGGSLSSTSSGQNAASPLLKADQEINTC